MGPSAAEDHDGHDGGGPEREPACVGAEIAGLDTAGGFAKVDGDPAGEAGEPVGDELVEAAQDGAGEAEQAGDEESLVKLVDVELVRDERLDRAGTAGEGGGGAGLADVEQVGEGEAEQGGQDGDCGKDLFGSVSYLAQSR